MQVSVATVALGIAAIWLPLACTRGAWAQDAGSPNTFEVASVKLAMPITDIPIKDSTNTSYRGMLRYIYVDLPTLITRAYGIKRYQIVGPEWLSTVHYDLIAKYPDGVSKETLTAMLRDLLVSRFNLQIHHEARSRKAYVLRVGKAGHRLSKSDLPSDALPRLSFSSSGHLAFTNITMPKLADALASFVGMPVVDQTGLVEKFDIVLDVAADELPSLQRNLGISAPNNITETLALNRPSVSTRTAGSVASLFAALQSLGLVLGSQEVSMQHLVIDSVNRLPTAN